MKNWTLYVRDEKPTTETSDIREVEGGNDMYTIDVDPSGNAEEIAKRVIQALWDNLWNVQKIIIDDDMGNERGKGEKVKNLIFEMAT